MSIAERAASLCGSSVVIENDPIKGRRLVAARDFAERQVVAVEGALLWARWSGKGGLSNLAAATGGGNSFEDEGVLEAAVATLSFHGSSDGALSDALAAASELHPVIYSIFQANGVLLEVLNDDASDGDTERRELWIALLLVCSMLNHSCDDPNCYWVGRWSKGSEGTPPHPEFIVSAHRGIRAGEELTISYVGRGPMLLDPGKAKERKDELQRVYGFSCECMRCNHIGSAPATLEGTFDPRASIESKIDHHADSGRYKEALSLVQAHYKGKSHYYQADLWEKHFTLSMERLDASEGDKISKKVNESRERSERARLRQADERLRLRLKHVTD
jgi:SET domain